MVEKNVMYRWSEDIISTKKNLNHMQIDWYFVAYNIQKLGEIHFKNGNQQVVLTLFTYVSIFDCCWVELHVKIILCYDQLYQ